jgi:hypothetical protein
MLDDLINSPLQKSIDKFKPFAGLKGTVIKAGACISETFL